MAYDILDHALEYAGSGIAIFPVHYPIDGKTCSCRAGARCLHVGKHPATEHGFADATVVESDIRARWRRPFNIGAPTGKLFDVLDEDPAHGGREALDALQEKYGLLPPTLSSQTGGGGRHFFYQHIDGVKNNNTGKVGAGLDFKTNGGYVVMPPSLHRSGQRYRWFEEENQIAVAPGWLVELLQHEFPAGDRRGRKADGYWARLADGVEAGDRHNAVASVAGLLLSRRGLSVLDIHLAARLVHGYNLECCDPPKSRDEVDAILAYVLKKKK